MRYLNHTLAANDYENPYKYPYEYSYEYSYENPYKYPSYKYLQPQPFYQIDYSLYQSQTLLYFMFTNITCFIILYILDYLLKKINNESRWFMLHAIINYIIAITTIDDVLACIANPLVSSHPMTLDIAGNIACALHIYHCIFFKIRFEDWIHHILSCFIFIPTCVKFSSKGLSVFYFFCTGLPGSIDYIVLSLVKIGGMVKKRQKCITSSLNAYIRMPGGVFCATLLFKDGLKIYSTNSNGLELMLLAVMIYVNSCFYGKQAMENYGMYMR